jgi:hypothetical protein
MGSPPLRPIDSSSIDAAGYDAREQELHVRFLESGETYVYEGVPELVWRQLLHAASKGTFLNDRIRDVYPFRHEPGV